MTDEINNLNVGKDRTEQVVPNLHLLTSWLTREFDRKLK